ncbi:MAG: hypothetical protein R2786_00900 [Flavobacteriaceae bacterium]
MKKIFLALVSVAILAISCDTKSKELNEKFTQLMTQKDSLQTVSADLQATFEKMIAMHKEMSTKINAMQPVDSTLLASLAEHEAAFANQSTVLEGQKKTFEGYTDLATSFASLTAEEKEAQINTIIENNSKMMEESATLKTLQENMMKAHEGIMAKLNDTTAVNTEENK